MSAVLPRDHVDTPHVAEERRQVYAVCGDRRRADGSELERGELELTSRSPARGALAIDAEVPKLRALRRRFPARPTTKDRLHAEERSRTLKGYDVVVGAETRSRAMTRSLRHRRQHDDLRLLRGGESAFRDLATSPC